MSEIDYCISCGIELIDELDSDPNGDKNCVCARCRAEEDHDFDAEPNVRFDRCGRMIEPPKKKRFNLELLPVSVEKLKASRKRLRATSDAEVIRRALDLLDVVSEHHINGGRTVLAPAHRNDPWPDDDIIAKLCEGVDILLHKRDYDGHGYEELQHAMETARERLKEPDREVVLKLLIG
jgi:hypothetical protein